MTWVRYDDNVANHPKVAPLDDATYRLWREALEWCAHNLTDGVVRVWQLTVTSTRASRPRAAKLVAAGLWHIAGSVCGSDLCPPSGEDGWFIHDYWDYQPTATKVRAEIAAKAERQRRWLDRKKDPPRDASKDAARDASKDGARDASKDGAPAPPRPAPKGREGTDVPSALPAAVGGGTATASEPNQQPPTQDPYGDEDPTAIAADQQRLLEAAAETARANANGAARSAAGAAAARAALAERKAR